MSISIRKADIKEYETLTKIAFAAKRYWNYPQSYYEIWKDELVVSEAYIRDNVVFVAQSGCKTAAFYSIVEVEKDFYSGETHVQKGFWLEHMFVLPEYIGQGIGKAMYAHALQYCRDNAIAELMIFADPNATGFYEKQGAEYIEDRPSSIEGRTVSLYFAKV